jgi:hypothetical protein
MESPVCINQNVVDPFLRRTPSTLTDFIYYRRCQVPGYQVDGNVIKTLSGFRTLVVEQLLGLICLVSLVGRLRQVDEKSKRTCRFRQPSL